MSWEVNCGGLKSSVFASNHELPRITPLTLPVSAAS
jgi:hypothetical protein